MSVNIAVPKHQFSTKDCASITHPSTEQKSMVIADRSRKVSPSSHSTHSFKGSSPSAKQRR